MIEVYTDYKRCEEFKLDGNIAKCVVCDNEICPKHKRLNVNDSVNRPAHYTDGKIEVIEYIEDKDLGFCLGNAIKYISRAGKKYKDKEIEDLKKAIWYIERRIKELEEATQ